MAALLGLVALAPMMVILWLMDFTFFVISPNEEQPAGEVLLVYDGPEANFIESAEAYCQRCLELSLYCRDFARLRSHQEIYLSLPYSETWLRLSGASVERWASLEEARG